MRRIPRPRKAPELQSLKKLVGDKLLVFGDLQHGIAIARAEDVIARHPGAEAIFSAPVSDDD